MGLDNGIYVKRDEDTNLISALQRFNVDWDKEHKYDFEIVYYRKCWNVRSMIFDAIKERAYNNDISEPLTIENIDNIIKGLKSFNSKNWQDNCGSIWDWDDEEWPYSKKVAQDIKNLKRLKKLMKKYDLEVYFVDSY